MGRNNTKAVKNIAKMYEQLGLAQDDIFHKTKLLLSIDLKATAAFLCPFRFLLSRKEKVMSPFRWQSAISRYP